MSVRTKLAALTAVGAALAPVAIATAPPAAAASSYARVSISASVDYPGYYNVYVYGHVHTDAYSLNVGMRLKGDDPIFNDDLSVSATGTAYYGDFSMYRLVWKSYLNEDWEGRDEIFAEVSASNGWRYSTPNVYGYF